MSMMMPVAKRLESISDKIMMTGETMLCNNKHENHDSSTDENDSGLTSQIKEIISTDCFRICFKLQKFSLSV